MKYFTKEWYEMCGKTTLHFMLEEAKHAETFSDEYFNKLYVRKQKEWTKENKKYLKELKKLESNTETDKPFESFHDFYLSQIDRAQKMLPETILSKIADIRVFALYKASRDVIKLTAEYCAKNQLLMEKAFEDYGKYLDEMSEELDEEIVSHLCFHDCRITKMDQDDKTMTIYFDNSGGFTDISTLRLNGYQVVKLDRSIVNAWWLYEEIYQQDGVYEIHGLLQNDELDLIDFIVSANSIQFS